MPTKISEINEANKFHNNLDYRIMRFLKKNPSDAFFIKELHEEVNDTADCVRISVKRLEKDGLIIKTKINGLMAVHLFYPQESLMH